MSNKTNTVTVAVSVELLDALPKNGSRNTHLMDTVRDYIIHKPALPDMRVFNCISTKSFTLRFRDTNLFAAFENECALQYRDRSNMLTVMLASIHPQ